MSALRSSAPAGEAHTPFARDQMPPRRGVDRLTTICLALLLAALAGVITIGIIFAGDGTPGSARISDFTAFWVAGRMALDGAAAVAYDRLRFVATASAMMGQPTGLGLGWLNPPSLLLVMAPLALLPYRWAWLAWLVLSAGFLAWVVFRILPRPRLVMLVLLTPAAILCAALGQNGFLTAALLGLAMLWLDRRPVAAGVCLGLLTFKPQFGVLLPVLLLASRRWSVLVAASGTTIILTGLSAVVFGVDALQAFLLSIPLNARHSLLPTTDAIYFHQSVHAAARAAGLAAVLAWSVHAAVGLAAAAVAWRCWSAAVEEQEEARAVATFAACMLITPYTFMYDQVLLGVAAAFLARAAARGRRLVGERSLAAIACLIPSVAFFAYVPIAAPAAWAIMLGLALRRVRASGA